MIKSLDQLVNLVKSKGRKFKIAITWGQDANTLGAVYRAAREGFIEAILIGEPLEIEKVCSDMGIASSIFKIIAVSDQQESAGLSVQMVKSGEADILMKGLIGTDYFLKAVMDRDKGLMKPDAVMSYVCAIQVPDYHKLLFVTDTAVIPFPDLKQKVAMANYAIEMTSRFGINRPKLALIGASEKLSKHFPSSTDYPLMCLMVETGEISDCIIDGPLDIFLACDKEAPVIKGVDTPVAGEADILLFPSLESCNTFYKGLMQFGKGELAGLLSGTTHPVVLMSRSESGNSKFYCIALSCLMADKLE
jgi:phosphate butyryltransferase